MPKGKIVQCGSFLNLEGGGKTRFLRNFLYSQILDGDEVTYQTNIDDVVVLQSIDSRIPIRSIGIISAIKGGKVYLHTPLLPTSFNASIHTHLVPTEHAKVGATFILYIERAGLHLIQYYGDIQDRTIDVKCLGDLYTQPVTQEYPLRIYPNSIPPCELVEEIGPNTTVVHTLPSQYCWPNTNLPPPQPYYTREFQDLSHLPTFNIDPAHSKDFDDAITIVPEENKIYVHIVDITQLELGGEIERHGAQMGFTLYMSEKNHNMLPSSLSEDAYSLVAHQPRRVITIEMVLMDPGLWTPETMKNNTLPIVSYEVYPSIIVVKDRYNYDDVLPVEESGSRPDLSYARRLCEHYYFRKLNIEQAKYDVDPVNGKLREISFPDKANDWSHQFIELSMIHANKVINEHLIERGVANLPERYHPPKFEGAPEIITGIESLDALLTIQKYRKATYQEDAHGHFGLQLVHYTHFTSPIRRYLDVIVARILQGYTYSRQKELLAHLNRREMLNRQIEKLYRKWKLMTYFQDRNEVAATEGNVPIYTAYILTVNPIGIKFYIADLGYDGFVKRTDEGTKTYLPGGTVEVVCKRVNFTHHDSLMWMLVPP